MRDQGKNIILTPRDISKNLDTTNKYYNNRIFKRFPVSVCLEMAEFVQSQIITEAATAMLGPENSYGAYLVCR
jgi:hypothetical protein